MTGERISQAGWLIPSYSQIVRLGNGGRIHQFLWQGSRLASKREKGTERRGAIRNRSKSDQVAQESFESGRIAVTRGKRLLLCISTGERLWRFRNAGFAK